jgi:hypothetical protein
MAPAKWICSGGWTCCAAPGVWTAPMMTVSSAIILSCENKLPDCNLEGTPAWCAVDDKRWRLFGAFVVLYEVWVRLFEDECHTSTVPQKGMISARGQ